MGCNTTQSVSGYYQVSDSAPAIVSIGATLDSGNHTIVHLSVVGQYLFGMSQLIYRWRVAGVPPNGSATITNQAAQSTTAALTSAGTYYFQVGLQTPSQTPYENLQTFGLTSIFVDQVLTSVTIKSVNGANSVALGGKLKYAATAYDQFGNVMATQPTFSWAVTNNNTIDSTGILTAATPGSYTVTASAAVNGITLSNRVTGTVTGIQIVAVSANPNPVTGQVTTLNVHAAEYGGTGPLTYTWSTISPSAGSVLFDANNGTNQGTAVNATFSQAGVYTFQILVQDTAASFTATASVSVTVTPTFTAITVNPPSAALTFNQFQTFTAKALDQFGQLMSPPQTSFTWSILAGGVGTIDQQGNYNSGNTPGSAKVQAQSGSCTQAAQVTVKGNASPVLTSLAVSPSLVTISAFQNQVFTVVAYDQSGKAMNPQPSFQWSLSGVGTLQAQDNTATFNSQDAGSSVITVTCNGLKTTASMVITPIAIPAPELATYSTIISPNYTFQITNEGAYQALRLSPTFNLTFSPVGSILETLPLSSLSRSPGSSPSYTASIQSYAFSPSSLQLPLGNYQFNVVAMVGNIQSQAYQGTMTLVSDDLNGVRVYPNPWRADKHTGLPVTFDHLSVNSTVKIYTLAGRWVKTLQAPGGSVTWDLTTDNGDHAASGIYLYLITNDQGQKSEGKFVLIR